MLQSLVSLPAAGEDRSRMNATIGERISITDWNDCRITVVIPTYNEADNLPAISEALLRLDWPYLQLLIVDDNSPDGTGAVADTAGRPVQCRSATRANGPASGAAPRRQGRAGHGLCGGHDPRDRRRGRLHGADGRRLQPFAALPAPDAGRAAGDGRRRGDRQPLRAGRLAGRRLGVEPAAAQLVGQPLQPGDPGAAHPRYDGGL